MKWLVSCEEIQSLHIEFVRVITTGYWQWLAVWGLEGKVAVKTILETKQEIPSHAISSSRVRDTSTQLPAPFPILPSNLTPFQHTSPPPDHNPKTTLAHLLPRSGPFSSSFSPHVPTRCSSRNPSVSLLSSLWVFVRSPGRRSVCFHPYKGWVPRVVVGSTLSDAYLDK